MAAEKYRDLRKFEVAEYSYAQKRIAIRVVSDSLVEAFRLFDQLLLDNGVPADAAKRISEKLRTDVLSGTTLYEHECLATNCRVSFIIRK